MASVPDPDAADQVPRSTSEKSNFQRLTRLLISGGTALLRESFDQICPPSKLPTILKNPATVKQLKAAKLTKPQWDCLYPSPGVYGKSSDFDVTLLFRLLRTICNLTPPAIGWDALPTSTDHSLAADLERIKYYRNTVYDHVNHKMEITRDKFPQFWQEISEVLVRIAGQISPTKKHEWKEAIINFLKNPLTAEDERNVQELQEWYRNEMEVKKSIEKLKPSTQVQSEMERPETTVREEVKDIKDQLGEIKNRLTGGTGVAGVKYDCKIIPKRGSRVGDSEKFVAPQGPQAVDKLGDIISSTVKFEADHDECVRVLLYKGKDGQPVVGLYVYHGKSGIPKELEAAAEDCFGGMDVNLEWFDLYNKSWRVLNVTPLEYPFGKPNRLKPEKVEEISATISKNLDIFSKHRNITAVQPSFKVTKSKQTVNPGIAVYVLGKGRIPLGESEIPHTIDGLPVDIVDGFWFEAVETWKANEAQKQCEGLPLGISIGIEGVEGCGTLGAIVEDGKNPGMLYALSCDHVLNSHTEQRTIIPPGLNDHQNNIRCLFKEFVALSDYIPGPNCLDNKSIDDLLETGNMLARLSKLCEVNKKNMDLLESSQTDPYAYDFADQDKFRKFYYYFKDGEESRKERVADLQQQVSALPELKKAIEEGLEKQPRNVATYTTGIKGNESFDDKYYFIDAAIAELNNDEVKELKKRVTTKIMGTHYYPNGECTPVTTEAITNAGMFCKSGRTTGYTESNYFLRSTSEAPTYLRTKFEWKASGGLPDVEMEYYFCPSCAKETRVSLKHVKIPCCTGCYGRASLNTEEELPGELMKYYCCRSCAKETIVSLNQEKLPRCDVCDSKASLFTETELPPVPMKSNFCQSCEKKTNTLWEQERLPFCEVCGSTTSLCNDWLPDVLIESYFCQFCAEKTKVLLKQEETLAYCKVCRSKSSVCTKWLENVLCIASEKDPFSKEGDSGSVIFKIEKTEERQNKCLSGFGLLFGVFDCAYKTCALASPLELALKRLSQEVSDSCELRLVSDYYG